jgi:hypothetical protein
MIRQELVEAQNAPQQTQSTTEPHTNTTKLFEIGSASTETKGTVRGLEPGFYPRN